LIASTPVLVLVVSSPSALAATYNVGPGQTYADLGAVAGLLAPGDVVVVAGNQSYPSVHFTNSGASGSPITITGMSVGGKRPIIAGGTNTIEAEGDHYVFENLEITGGSARCFFHHADDVVLRGSAVHDCPAQGILGADNNSGSLLMEFDEVYGCGNGTQNHQIYMATDEMTHPGSVFRMQYCYVHDGNGGNNVKSRAERNEIYSNWIEGAFYREIELIGPDPAGGTSEGLKREDSDVVGNVLFKRGTYWVARFGGDGTGQTNGRYRFVNNTVILQPGNSGVFQLFDGIESLESHNNVLFTVDGSAANVEQTSDAVWVTGSETESGTANWVPAGATNIPPSWTGTITGANPSFVSLTSPDLHPTAQSPLVDRGGPATQSPPGHPFPSPLLLPAYEPPMHAVGSTPTMRPVVGPIDIGAFEYGTAPEGGLVADASALSEGGASEDAGGGLDSGALSDAGRQDGSSDDGAGALTSSDADNAPGPAGSNADSFSQSAGCACGSVAAHASPRSVLVLVAGWAGLLVVTWTRRRRTV
jgi:hypothetical protein